MDETAQRTDAVPVPTAGHVLVRALPAAVVMTLGLPLVVWVTLDPSGQTRTPWWPVILAAAFALPLLLHHFARAPRPRRDKRAHPQRVKSVLAAPANGRIVPDDPGVRTSAATEACGRIEAAVSTAGSVGAFFILMLTRDAQLWTSLTIVFGIFALIHIVRARRSWAYLDTLHTAECTG